MTAKQYFRIAAIALVLGCVMGVLAASQHVVATMGSSEGGYTFGHALIMLTPFWVFWAPIVPLVFWLVQRYPLERGCPRRNVMLHVAVALVISVTHYGFQLWFMHAIGHGYPRGHSYFVHFFAAARWRLWMHVAGYAILLGIAVARDYYRRYRERELLASQLAAQLSQAKLHALRMQLNPHFLFNALNSIAMLARRSDNARAVRMIAGLGELLRHVLEDSPADEVTLREEVGFLARYLEIERVRFHDRLQVNVDVAEETLEGFVPNLLLQPIVENALQHGIARKVGPGRVDVVARRVGDRVVLQVSDDGPGLGIHAGSGVGLANTRNRLEQLYGEQFSFEVRNGEDGGVVVMISLPYHGVPVTVAAHVA
jgi:signal transduction histidine kinase